ncbi:MAG: hypothetical protein HY064_16635 [Bacteroidetes bacterium]|nr:hypothetical protein [Bacteroidota bacterium]
MLAAFIFSCRTAVALFSDDDVARAKKINANADVQQLSDGQKLYNEKCGSCHYLHQPADFNSQKWDTILPGMKNDAKLNDEEYQRIKIYILTMCDAPPPGKGTKKKER